jgi:tRNA(fMet)-specific endonuclease VapC
MAVLIDSSVLIAWERGGAQVTAWVRGREDELAFLSVITVSELLHGVHRAVDESIQSRRSAFVEAVLARFPTLSIDLGTARQHSRLWALLAAKGTMIGLHDTWLAAACLAHGLTMLTANGRDFERVPGLTVEAWPPVRTAAT